ncbi:MAG TPA: DNA polymerase III subunit gamma/tau [Candidatus Baltobacteraceae bacterium]|nr:DNA polymerase III subunit gamma/tau [Candidatus Baltobacteraceae bacterium]
MSLYRTWRPKSFADLVGQDAVVRTLSSALESGKLAHAYLFSGPRGSGKTSAAKILARCINCVNGPTATPDNTCENCRAILAGTALDVLEIDAASNRGIDEIRALRDAVKFAPSVMRMKVYIIDEAHMLTKEGANAFLKTLEEPPPHAVFVLATTEPEKLPVTILSRCQRYAFRRIAIPVMIERMREIASAEGIAIDEAALSAIAYRADGGLRDALTMLEQAAAFAEGAIGTQTIDLAFGATGRKYAAALLDQLIAKDAPGVLQTIDQASDAGTDMQVLLRSLIGEFRNLLVGRIDPQLLSRDLAPEDAQRAADRGKQLTQVQIVRALRLLSEALSTARSSGNPRLELETALLRYALAAEDPTLDAISARLSALEEGKAATSSAMVRQAHHDESPAPREESAAPREESAALGDESGAAGVPSAPSPRHAEPVEARPSDVEAKTAGPVTIQRVRAAWESIVMKVESEKQSLRGELRRAMPDSVDGSALVVKVPNAISAEVLKDNGKLIQSAIQEALGVAMQVKFQTGGAASARARGGGAARTAASVQAGEPQSGAIAEDPDELFSYLNERIR